MCCAGGSARPGWQPTRHALPPEKPYRERNEVQHCGAAQQQQLFPECSSLGSSARAMGVRGGLRRQLRTLSAHPILARRTRWALEEGQLMGTEKPSHLNSIAGISYAPLTALELVKAEQGHIQVPASSSAGFVARSACQGALNLNPGAKVLGPLAPWVLSGARGLRKHPHHYNPNAWQKPTTENDDEDEQVTPWVRSVASGIEILRNPKYNKGLAFSEEERDRLYLHGLLPAGHMDQELQVQRVLVGMRSLQSDLDKYVFLMALQERNERLFYRVVMEYIEEVMPIIHTPTVGLVCQKYGLMFQRPRGLFLSVRDRGRVMEVLKNWPERRVKAIVCTDGERVLGLGDLGVQGMAIAVSKLCLYTACGGIHPAECLPVTIDVGTNNQALLQDPIYPGLRQPRVPAEEYDDLIDEFMDAVKQRYGAGVLIQFEDFARHNAFRLLFQYRGSHLVFNDDMQGTAAVALAGLLAALPLAGGSLGSHKFLFFGAGEAGTGIAELLSSAIRRETGETLEESRKRIWLMDSQGLIVRSRIDSLQAHKVLFANEHRHIKDLPTVIQELKPSVLIGVSSCGGAFTEDALKAMATCNERPIIFALSNPTSHSECTAEQAYKWTEGRAIFASGSPFAPVELNGRVLAPGQGNNAYAFPGIVLGCLVSGATRLRDEMFLAAAEALAAQVSDEDRDVGRIYPPLGKIREVSAHIARAVASKAYELGLATNLPKPPDLLAYTVSHMYRPHYRSFK